MRMANQALESVRKMRRASLSDRQRRTRMHDRHVLVRRQADLRGKDQLILESWQGALPLLAQAYRCKEAILGDVGCKHRDRRTSAVHRLAAVPSGGIGKSLCAVNHHDGELARGELQLFCGAGHVGNECHHGSAQWRREGDESAGTKLFFYGSSGQDAVCQTQLVVINILSA